MNVENITMINYNKLLFMAAVITMMAACKNPKASEEEVDTVAQPALVTAPAAGFHRVSLKDDLLNSVYTHYMKLTTALIDGDVAEAKVAANAIALGAKNMNKGNELVALSTKIMVTDDLDEQRIAYASLSRIFIERAKTSGMNSGKLYVAYCPMAMDDKGASWLSNQQDIRNPYFGESMLDCGAVKETID